MSAEESCSELFAAIEAEQARLRAVVAGRDAAALVRRPPNGAWSVAENVRHLVFAEQVHLGGLLPGRRDWSTLRLPPYDMQVQRQLKMVGSAATDDVQAVLDTWAKVHISMSELAGHESEDVRRAMVRHLRHQRSHVRRVESLLRARR